MRDFCGKRVVNDSMVLYSNTIRKTSGKGDFYGKNGEISSEPGVAGLPGRGGAGAVARSGKAGGRGVPGGVDRVDSGGEKPAASAAGGRGEPDRAEGRFGGAVRPFSGPGGNRFSRSGSGGADGMRNESINNVTERGRVKKRTGSVGKPSSVNVFYGNVNGLSLGTVLSVGWSRSESRQITAYERIIRKFLECILNLSINWSKFVVTENPKCTLNGICRQLI